MQCFVCFSRDWNGCARRIMDNKTWNKGNVCEVKKCQKRWTKLQVFCHQTNALLITLLGLCPVLAYVDR